MKELYEFVKNLDEYKNSAWAKRCDSKKDPQLLISHIEWYSLSETKRIGLGYLKEGDQWGATLSITRDTPDEWKPVLLSVAMELAGKPVEPEMGTNCVLFHWSHSGDPLLH